MIRQRAIRVLPATVLVLASALNAFAQITTGTVSGTIKDTTGAVVPGATVVLVSEAKGTRSVPAVTNGSGDYVFPNVTADTYRVEATLEGFHSISRGGVIVSSGERVSVPALVLAPGGTQETVTVTAVSPLVQASSGERSYAVSTEQIENLVVIAKEKERLQSEVEIASEVADGPYSVILDQVTNGVAVRMAVLYLLLGGAEAA